MLQRISRQAVPNLAADIQSKEPQQLDTFQDYKEAMNHATKGSYHKSECYEINNIGVGMTQLGCPWAQDIVMRTNSKYVDELRMN